MNKTLLSAARTEAYDRLVQTIRGGRKTALTGLPDSLAVFLASALADQEGLRVLLVTANDLRAARASENAAQWLGGGARCLAGGEIDLTRGSSSREGNWRRLETLTAVGTEGVRVLTVSMDALLQRMGDPEEFRMRVLRLRPGDRLAPSELIARLTRMGYERVEMVEGKGQCALRGSILDVYPPSASQGYRIEYFDDEIDSVRAFDCISQRSLDREEEALLSPAGEVLIPEAEAPRAAARMREALKDLGGAADDGERLFDDLPPIPEDDDELEGFFDGHVAPKAARKQRAAEKKQEYERRSAALQADADALEGGVPFKRIRPWLPVLTDKVFTALDWYRPQVILLCAPDQLRERAAERRKGFAEELANAVDRCEAVPAQEGFLLDWDSLAGRMDGFPLVTASELLLGLGGIRPDEVIDLEASGVPGYASRLKALADDLGTWRDRGWRVALLSGGVARGQRLQQSLSELGAETSFSERLVCPEPGRTAIVPATLSAGFIWPGAGLVVVADADIWGRGYHRSRSKRTSGEKINTFTELNAGDYVVHEDHGVGIYQGTVRMQNAGTARDYLLIQYAGSDKLYVPIEQLARVQRYIGNPSQAPKLNHIGGGEWSRQKGKVKEGLRKLAFDLTALYARREKERGHAFAKDTAWQREFEDRFPYELTPDQEQSVREIAADMESDRNMDRLLIGDVGYGKTEVSLRAAFKAVMDSKQVAILAPTTILAQQHFNTVVKRFEGFPVRVEVLSRFRTAREQKQVLADTAAGKVDILVGTHRILAKDVQFKDLGLLIVDEEQRFGVQHKEIIKNMKTQMDVLTLSATPIPRTLHMSMVGIRDMSVLETPPEDRLPVQTHVVEYSDALVRDAILRELSRGGQVYFLYNRVRSIERFYERLRALVPEARIGVAHGQMRENALEDVMMDFYGGSYDVLLCTTIIESGLDVPTANTLIVFDADRFGLSQLYQLRGRVGRSSVQAYAFFTVRQDRMISETAEQRLSAIREFTEFGAGFRIAMRDLEIRGAGNILGPEQHGHLATVGYEMYCKLIEEAVAEVRGEQDRSGLETRVDLRVDAYLPEEYIRDGRQRMEMYRRIAAITSDADRGDVLDELIDRFGEVPPVVGTLLDVSLLRSLCSRIGVSQVMMRGSALQMKVDERYVPDPGLLLRSMQDTDGRLVLSTAKPTAILLKGGWKDERDALTESVRVMRRLNGRLDALEAEAREKAENT